MVNGIARSKMKLLAKMKKVTLIMMRLINHILFR